MTSFRPEHPVIAHAAAWYVHPMADNYATDLAAVQDSWSALLPLFAAKGYIEYPQVKLLTSENEPIQQLLENARMNGPLESECIANQSYPFPRVFFRYKSTNDIRMFPPSTVKYFWDREKRDVVFKLVHGNELKVLQYLNAPEMRANPMNRTIPVLEFITYDKLTFAVMPRWEGELGGLCADFANVHQLLHVCQHLFEGLDFLHEHRIFHNDLDGRNIAFNAISDPLDEYPTGLLEPGETDFVFLDFGMSSIYSLETELDGVAPVRANHNLSERPPPAPPLSKYCNPFRADVLNLAMCLERIVRVAQDIVPELVPFFEAHTKQNVDSNPSAREMLNAFQTICANIPPEKLDTPITGRFWDFESGIIPKTEDPSRTRIDYIRAQQEYLLSKADNNRVTHLPLREIQP
ncbi:hypothetical protein C8J56DRAFT_953989 [Mycena floridula]|nr:hypothetical protein C8J56DRAFT_953989 [Mycena floridula]